MPVLAPVISITLPSAMALVLSLRVRRAMDDATRARFPDVPQAAGHYESYYMRAAHPTEPLGVWIRYTVHKRPDALPTASLWFTLFDDAAEGPLASKVTHPHSELAAGGERYIEIAGSTFGPQRVVGEARTDACDATWELEISDGEPELLPSAARLDVHRAHPAHEDAQPAPRGALQRPPERGRPQRGASTRWPGMVGHNWGAEHAERWVWMHAIGFEGQPESTWLDVAIGRVKVGPLTTPWIASGGGLDRRRAARAGRRGAGPLDPYEGVADRLRVLASG